jgi:transcriptional regulator with XRE-family HTH domain
MDRLANKLVRLRKEKKLTQEGLAKKIGVSRPTIVNYENGRRKPDYEILQRIADVLEVSTDMLLGRDFNEEEEIKTKIKNNVPLDKIAEEHTFTIKGEIMDEEDKMELLRYAEAIMIMKKMKKD